MIKKLKSGYRLYSRKKDPKTGKRRNLGTFKTRAAAKKHEKDVQKAKGQQRGREQQRKRLKEIHKLYTAEQTPNVA